MKKVVKFKFQDKEGFLSVVEKSNQYYALVQKDTPKVADIQNTNQLLISYELKQPNYKEVSAKILFDQELIKWVYHSLEEDKNLYFKQLDDSLCVIEFAVE
ncbi:hypothetical protein [Peloplasma aerotolerans]|jgi:general stress protein 26|uniref:Uncharacterized protein n=1 Tax=Peloplasma aerotolerans TaxID=3044389 RepID=A0AAW6U798_9MOLU|nr:hypothetical protein [Mariniplasma sp. M4Ah]MDI6452800.1 hypothetical protein [Mariniplasma sp. M4Ah]